MAERRSPKPGKPGKSSYQKSSGGSAGGRSKTSKGSYISNTEGRKSGGFKQDSGQSGKVNFSSADRRPSNSDSSNRGSYGRPPSPDRPGYEGKKFDRTDSPREGGDRFQGGDRKPRPSGNREGYNSDRKREGGSDFSKRPASRGEGYSSDRKRDGGSDFSKRPASRGEGYSSDRKREGGSDFSKRPASRGEGYNSDRKREGGSDFSKRPASRGEGYNPDRKREGGSDFNKRPASRGEGYNSDRKREGGSDFNKRPASRGEGYNSDRKREGGSDFNKRPASRGEGYNSDRKQEGGSGFNKRPSNRDEGFKPERNTDGATLERSSRTRESEDFRPERRSSEEGDRPERPARNEGYGDRKYHDKGASFGSSRPSYGQSDGFRPERKKEDGYLRKLKEEGKGKSSVFSAVSQNWAKPPRPGQGRPPGNSRFKPGAKTRFEPEEEESNGLIRLNRFISNAGICSRRDADELIANGMIVVNGKTLTEMGYQVKPTDIVKYGKRIISREKLVYLLLNKPKNFITTLDDPEQRRTVIDIIKPAVPERVYPVGRLDRNTTGLLLMTNDGELAEKLSHPSHKVKKVYEVTVDRPITTNDLEAIRNGVELEDGKAHIDAVEIVSVDKQTLGLEIHSGRNRIVRRIFEHLKYDVTKLDRVMYAGLTKKNLTRGQWRFLTEQEIINLKYLS